MCNTFRRNWEFVVHRKCNNWKRSSTKCSTKIVVQFLQLNPREKFLFDQVPKHPSSRNVFPDPQEQSFFSPNILNYTWDREIKRRKFCLIQVVSYEPWPPLAPTLLFVSSQPANNSQDCVWCDALLESGETHAFVIKKRVDIGCNEII